MQDHQDWHNRWENNRIGFHEGCTNGLLEAHFQRFELAPQSRVFVPLCGKAVDMFWLAQQGYRVSGIELSTLALQQFFNEHQLAVEISTEAAFSRFKAEDIELLAGDFFKLQAEHLALPDCIYDRASLIALPAELRPHYARHLMAIYPEVPMLLITLDYEQARMSGPPFSVTEAEVQQLYAERYDITRLERRDCLHESARFQQLGLKYLNETAYQLKPKTDKSGKPGGYLKSSQGQP